MRSNCLLWAVTLYLRRRRRGRHGYVIARRSHWGPFPHFMYAERRAGGQLRVVGYAPLDPKPRRVPPVLFLGAVVWGDS